MPRDDHSAWPSDACCGGPFCMRTDGATALTFHAFRVFNPLTPRGAWHGLLGPCRIISDPLATRAGPDRAGVPAATRLPGLRGVWARVPHAHAESPVHRLHVCGCRGQGPGGQHQAQVRGGVGGCGVADGCYVSSDWTCASDRCPVTPAPAPLPRPAWGRGSPCTKVPEHQTTQRHPNPLAPGLP